MKTSDVERNAGKRNYCTNVAIKWKKVDNRRLKNCVKLLSKRVDKYHMNALMVPFKETYGETF